MCNINHVGDRSAEVSNNHIAMTVDRSGPVSLTKLTMAINQALMENIIKCVHAFMNMRTVGIGQLLRKVWVYCLMIFAQ